MRPLIDLTKKGKVFNWTTKCQEALDDLKITLTGPEIIAFQKRMVRIYLIVMLVTLEFQAHSVRYKMAKKELFLTVVVHSTKQRKNIA